MRKKGRKKERKNMLDVISLPSLSLGQHTQTDSARIFAYFVLNELPVCREKRRRQKDCVTSSDLHRFF